MKKILPAVIALHTFTTFTHAQVTRISNNTNLQFGAPINGTKAFFIQPIEGRTDYNLWFTDGTAANTVQTSAAVTIESDNSVGFFNNKVYFSGVTDANGAELWVTDGTNAGTVLVKDINTGASSSNPKGFIVFNGALYFFANTNSGGYELYKSDGTAGGTALLKEINIGAAGSYTDSLSYAIYNNELYFSAVSATNGIELWKTNGTTAGTALVKDINVGGSSTPQLMQIFNNELFFTANDGAHGREFWKTNGTEAGTSMVKDIATGAAGSGIDGATLLGNKMLFAAEATPGDRELYSSDGSNAGTGIVKDINTGAAASDPDVNNGIIINNKLIFSATSAATGDELFVTDGTNGGTTLFREFVPGTAGSNPDIWLDRNFFSYVNNQNYDNNRLLYNGKIFFTITNIVNGLPAVQLWVTDGTAGNTVMVADFGSVFFLMPLYFYTQSGLYFSGFSADKGYEVWKSQATPQTTAPYTDVYTGSNSSNPFFQFFILNGKVFFIADDGDSETATDLFVINGTEITLPLQLLQFAAAAAQEGVQLNWVTAQEHNTKNFDIERSVDGSHFTAIGTQKAGGNTTGETNYEWLDKDAYSQKTSTLYYRLKQVDVNGHFNYSKIAMIRLAAPAVEHLSISPNPANSFTRINVASDKTTTAQLNILSTNGQLVKSFSTTLIKGNNQQVIDLQNVPPGIYNIQLIIPGKSTETSRFVKQ